MDPSLPFVQITVSLCACAVCWVCCVLACRLESRGPSWQTPSIMDVLRRPPFLAGAPEDLLLWLRAYGELASYQPGQCIIPRRVRGKATQGCG